MIKMIALLGKTKKREFFTLPCILLLVISCTKEYSFEGSLTTVPVSIFTNQIPPTQTYNDDSLGGIELGVKFRSAIDGKVDGIKFYKTTGNIGTHTAQLYNDYGAPLATAVFMNESDSGWQSVIFATAVPITANTTYVAAYYSSLGNYSQTAFGLKNAVTNAFLTALADSTQGLNGVFKYTAAPDFPIFGYQSSNYWVDVIASDK